MKSLFEKTMQKQKRKKENSFKNMLNYKPVSITSFDLNLLLYQNISDIYRLRLSHWKILRFESGIHYFQPTVWCCYLWRNNASWMWKETYKSECWESFWGKMPVADHVKNLYDCHCGQIWKLATCLCFSLKLGPVGWGCYLDSDCT